MSILQTIDLKKYYGTEPNKIYGGEELPDNLWGKK